jgi:hypothetical protein
VARALRGMDRGRADRKRLHGTSGACARSFHDPGGRPKAGATRAASAALRSPAFSALKSLRALLLRVDSDYSVCREVI